MLELETSSSWKSLCQQSRPGKEKTTVFQKWTTGWLFSSRQTISLLSTCFVIQEGWVTHLPFSSVTDPSTSVTPCFFSALSWLSFGEIFIFLPKCCHWGLLRHPQTPLGFKLPSFLQVCCEFSSLLGYVLSCSIAFNFASICTFSSWAESVKIFPWHILPLLFPWHMFLLLWQDLLCGFIFFFLRKVRLFFPSSGSRC